MQHGSIRGMGFRFRRSVRLLPGIRLNFGLRGISTSVGGRGFTLNFSKRGVRSTVGLPGTGISYSEMLTRNAGVEEQQPAAGTGSSFGWGTWLFILVAVVLLTKWIGGSEPPAEAPAVDAAETAVAAPLPTATVTARVLKCRAAPTTSARVMTRLPQGTVVRHAEEQSGWVRLPDTGGCWVAKRFLRELGG